MDFDEIFWKCWGWYKEQSITFWKLLVERIPPPTFKVKRDRVSVALYATEERSPKMKNTTQTTLSHFNFSVTAELNDVTSRLIILINEEINEANCMVRNSAKLDRRTKQHTQFGVSTSDGSRDMARTKSWRKKEKEK